jgi:hypothetical protein
MADDTTTTSISLDETVLELSRKRARRERRSFSAHSAKLLEADLVAAGWIDASGGLTEAGKVALAEKKDEVTA